ncbi:Ribosome biogenesis protein brx1 [Rhizophlyctis rosea]|uniref:Ribosome biogenesis protein brx1 n=1 Tax=Rhizophlyctis rosea TaxID=64517 RepID=A0AAD5SE06_9FUNG|nr:Ribosome biogenesis protein brx1 [Rhizophlyctis rosea]
MAGPKSLSKQKQRRPPTAVSKSQKSPKKRTIEDVDVVDRQPRKRKEIVSVDLGGGNSDMEGDDASSGGSDNDFEAEDGEDEEEGGGVVAMGRKALLMMQGGESGEEEEEGDEEMAEEEAEEDEDEDEEMEDAEEGDEEEDDDAPRAFPKPEPYRIKQRVLMLSSRGITHRYRHLLTDLQALLPHSKKDAKLDQKGSLDVINELAELNNCNNAIYFEVRKHTDLYMWMSKTPNGPSVKFHVQNVHTMDELRMTGNCLKGSRPILSFDKNFDEQPHYQLLKEMFTQVFGTPRTSRKIKPFFDHILSFSITDNKIWFRNYQIVEKQDSASSKKQPDITLVEIGPRFVMSIMRIFDGSFGGSTLFENSDFVSPNMVRRLRKNEKSTEYRKRSEAILSREEKMKSNRVEEDPLMSVFK